MYIFISVSSSVHPLLTDENNVFHENCLIPKGTFLWILWRISQGIPITLLKIKYYNGYSSNRLYILHYCYFICSYVFRFMSYCSLITITRDSRLVCMLLSSLFLISMLSIIQTIFAMLGHSTYRLRSLLKNYGQYYVFCFKTFFRFTQIFINARNPNLSQLQPSLYLF